MKDLIMRFLLGDRIARIYQYIKRVGYVHIDIREEPEMEPVIKLFRSHNLFDVYYTSRLPGEDAEYRFCLAENDMPLFKLRFKELYRDAHSIKPRQ